MIIDNNTKIPIKLATLKFVNFRLKEVIIIIPLHKKQNELSSGKITFGSFSLSAFLYFFKFCTYIRIRNIPNIIGRII